MLAELGSRPLDVTVSEMRDDFLVREVPYRAERVVGGAAQTITTEDLFVHGVPFLVHRRDARILPMAYNRLIAP